MIDKNAISTIITHAYSEIRNFHAKSILSLEFSLSGCVPHSPRRLLIAARIIAGWIRGKGALDKVVVLRHERPPRRELVMMLGSAVPACRPGREELELLQVLLVAPDLPLPEVPLLGSLIHLPRAVDIRFQLRDHLQQDSTELVLKAHEFCSVAHHWISAAAEHSLNLLVYCDELTGELSVSRN